MKKKTTPEPDNILLNKVIESFFKDGVTSPWVDDITAMSFAYLQFKNMKQKDEK